MEKAHKNKKLWMAAVVLLVLGGCGSSSDYYGSGSSSGDNAYEMESGGVSFTNEYSSPSELSQGDIMYINFNDSGEAEVDFSGVASGAKFIMVVGSAAENGGSESIGLSGDLSAVFGKDIAAESLEEKDYTAEEMLSAWLRAAEYEIAASLPAPSVNAQVKAINLGKAVGVGDTETFRVLSSLSSVSSYTTVEAEVRCVGDEVIFYVDVRVSSENLSDADIDSICSDFDRVAQDEQNLFGDASDINSDGHVAILMTPQINRLGSMGGGIITGYFWAGDLYAQNGANPVSNAREMIYTMVPDPNGTYGFAVTKDFTLGNLIPAVLPHELQHAISYNQHVFVKAGTPEANWLNEGLAHLAEDIMGYGMENPSRYALFLASTASYGLVVLGQPNLVERGAAYLFLRYLYEQAASPNDFIANLLNTSAIGVDNLEQAFNGASGFSRFHEFMARWTVALAVTNEGVTQDSRYVYRTRTESSTTGNWQGVCLKCDADDGRATQLNGVTKTEYAGSGTATLTASAAKFYRINSVPARLTLQGESDRASFGVLIREE